MDTTATVAPWIAGSINLGFVAWLAHHLITKSIPKIVDDGRADAKVAREAYMELVKQERELFSTNLAAVIHVFDSKIDALMKAFDAEQTASRAQCIQEIRETNDRWREIWMTGYKEGKEAAKSPDQSGIHA